MNNEIKTWQERAKEDGVWPIFDGATASRFMVQEIAELRAKVESLAADAERYRWLRATENNGYSLKSNAGIGKFNVTQKVAEGEGIYIFGASMDLAINLEMAKEKA